MTDSDRQTIHARLAHWPGERYACAWPTDPEQGRQRFWLFNADGERVATFHRYEIGRGWPNPRRTR